MVKAYASSVIAAPAEQVWRVVRDFNALPDWHPAIAESRIEGGLPGDKVGCIRNFTLTDGGRIREQLLSLSDFDYAFSYSILESPMPLTDYVAEFRLVPVTDGNVTFAEWQATFQCAPEDATRLSDLVGNGVFQGGFDALKQRFGQG